MISFGLLRGTGRPQSVSGGTRCKNMDATDGALQSPSQKLMHGKQEAPFLSCRHVHEPRCSSDMISFMQLTHHQKILQRMFRQRDHPFSSLADARSRSMLLDTLHVRSFMPVQKLRASAAPININTVDLNDIQTC